MSGWVTYFFRPRQGGQIGMGMDAMKLIGLLSLLIIATLVMVFSGCGPRTPERPSGDAPIVRVRVASSLQQAKVRLDQPPTLHTDNGTTQRRLGADPGQTVVVQLVGGAWMINGAKAGTGVMEMFPSVDGSLALEGAAYRGSLRFVPAENGKFDVVNVVDVERYLQGVLARELFADWHPEAYRAQAVIARTYALYEVKTGPTGRHFDLHADERSQVYGGISAETDKANAAVEATRGVVATWGPTGQEKIFKAYFSSCCGGVSASAGDAFKEAVIPPLDAKYNGNTCSISTRYNWGPVVLRKDELTRRIKAWGTRSGHPVGQMRDLATMEVATTNAFGRPRRFAVTDTAGQQYVLSSEETRWAINTGGSGVTVFSGFFKPIDAGDSIQLVEGHGFGHGVGACQWCMQARAMAGEGFESIVVKAYPQSKVLLAY